MCLLHWTWNSLRLSEVNLEEKNLFGPRAHLLLQFFLCYRASSRENTRDEEKKKKKIELFREKREKQKDMIEEGWFGPNLSASTYVFFFQCCRQSRSFSYRCCIQIRTFFFLGARPMSLSSFRLEPFHWTRMIESSNAASYVDEHRPWRFISCFYFFHERLCLRNSAFVATFLKGDFLFFTCPFESFLNTLCVLCSRPSCFFQTSLDVIS